MDGHTVGESLLPDMPGLRPKRACRNCVKIKAKCVPLAGGEQSICQRCHRLGKQCTTPAPLARKAHSKRKGSPDLPRSTTTGFPGLISLPPSSQDGGRIRSELASRIALSQPVGALSANSVHPATPISPGEPCPPTARPVRTHATPENNPTAPDHFPKGRTQTAGSAFDVSPEIGHSFTLPRHEQLFEYFQAYMGAHFPFITLTNDSVAMRKERPFTYVACVMTAAHRDPTFQYRISRDILRYLGEHMLLAGEKSLDILQGLLIMVTWYHVYTHSNPQLMNIVHLAKALLVDLGLNRPPGAGLFRIGSSNDGMKLMHGPQLDLHKHSLEERRACLGVYHVSFTISACFRRLDSMCWTDHMEECCQALQNATENASDAYIVALVRLDHLADRYTTIDGGHQTLNMPIQTYVKLFSEELEAFKQSLPPQLQTDGLMNSHIQSARLFLFERVTNSADNLSTPKVEALHACLAGVLEYFEFFMSQAIEEIPRLPFLFWSTIAQALDLFAKLSFIEVENWDLEYVRNNPGFMSIADQIIQKCNEVQLAEEANHPGQPNGRFRRFSSRVDHFKRWYRSRLDLDVRARSEGLEQETEAVATFNNPVSGSHPGEFADMLWQDIFPDFPDWAGLDNSFGIARD